MLEGSRARGASFSLQGVCRARCVSCSLQWVCRAPFRRCVVLPSVGVLCSSGVLDTSAIGHQAHGTPPEGATHPEGVAATDTPLEGDSVTKHTGLKGPRHTAHTSSSGHQTHGTLRPRHFGHTSAVCCGGGVLCLGCVVTEVCRDRLRRCRSEVPWPRCVVTEVLVRGVVADVWVRGVTAHLKPTPWSRHTLGTSATPRSRHTWVTPRSRSLARARSRSARCARARSLGSEMVAHTRLAALAHSHSRSLLRSLSLALARARSRSRATESRAQRAQQRSPERS